MSASQKSVNFSGVCKQVFHIELAGALPCRLKGFVVEAPTRTLLQVCSPLFHMRFPLPFTFDYLIVFVTVIFSMFHHLLLLIVLLLTQLDQASSLTEGAHFVPT